MYKPNIKYRFVLNNGVTDYNITPIYGDDATIDITKEKGEAYFIEKLTGGLTLMRSDCDYINSVSFDQEFTLKLQRDLGDGSGYVERLSLGFNKTNCKFSNTNNQPSIIIAPETYDRYRQIKAGSKKEYDIIKLGANKTKVLYKKQIVIQIYTRGASYLTSFFRGSYMEQTVDNPTFSKSILSNDYKFGYLAGTGFDGSSKVFIPGESAGNLIPDVSGSYSYNQYIRDDNRYRLYSIGVPNTRPEGPADAICIMAYQTATLDDFDDVLSIWQDDSGHNYEFIGVVENDVANEDRLYWRALGTNAIPSTGNMTHISGAVNTATFAYLSSTIPFGGIQLRRIGIYDENPPVPFAVRYVYFTASVEWGDMPIYGEGPEENLFYSQDSLSTCRVVDPHFHLRVLSDKDTINGLPTVDVPTDDILATTSNYKKVIGLENNNFVIHDGNQLTPERFGRYDEDAALFAEEYFSEYIAPIPSGIIQTYPVNRSEWKDASVWWYHDFGIEALFEDNMTDMEVRHAYSLHEVISTLLSQIDPTLTFSNDIAHSEFLYSVNNPVSGDAQPQLFLTKKSNIIVGNYDKPSEVANIKLQDLLASLKTMYNLYWHIDDSNRLRIEHIKYYEKGGSYSTDIIGTDLTALLSSKNKRSLSFGQNTYEYNKLDIAEQLKFSWMDKDVTEPFVGYPIEINSNYVTLGKIDEKNIPIITTDLDYIQWQPSTISQDGYVMLAAFINSDGEYEVPFLEMEVATNRNWNMQNGHLAFIYLHDKYHRHNMPASDVTINELSTTATTIKKNKVQNLEYPATDNIDPMELITTDLGNGTIQKIGINLSTNQAKATIDHDTEL